MRGGHPEHWETFKARYEKEMTGSAEPRQHLSIRTKDQIAGSLLPVSPDRAQRGRPDRAVIAAIPLDLEWDNFLHGRLGTDLFPVQNDHGAPAMIIELNLTHERRLVLRVLNRKPESSAIHLKGNVFSCNRGALGI